MVFQKETDYISSPHVDKVAQDYQCIDISSIHCGLKERIKLIDI
jgi:hypothetical protein